MKVHKTVLPNGLRLLVSPMPSLESATVTVWVRVGSRLEEASVAGISHFLEHMAFKGGEKYKSAKDVSEAVDAMGAENNAGTSKEWTNFYIKSSAKTVDRAFDILSDITLKPKLSQEDIDRERGVIIEEMNMYEDTPMYRIGDIFDQVMFPGTPLGVDIIGNKKSVGAINRSHFVDFRDTHYHPENIVVTVAGGVDEKHIISLADTYFGFLEKTKTKHPDQEITVSNGGNLKLVSKKNEQAHFIVGYSALEYGAPNRHILDVLTAILGQGMSSRLFTEVREKRGLAYSVRTSADYFIDTGSVGTYAGVDPKKATEALKVILSEHEKITNLGSISKEELTKAKEYLKGHIALSLENTKSVNNFFGYDELMLGKTTTPEEEYALIDSVTTDQLYELAGRLFVPEQARLAIIGPFEDGKEFENILKSA